MKKKKEKNNSLTQPKINTCTCTNKDHWLEGWGPLVWGMRTTGLRDLDLWVQGWGRLGWGMRTTGWRDEGGWDDHYLTSHVGTMETQTSWTMSFHPASSSTAASRITTRSPEAKQKVNKSIFLGVKGGEGGRRTYTKPGTQNEFKVRVYNSYIQLGGVKKKVK